MGNVAGVGQFLETVGVPGPQVGVQAGLDGGVPGQDFATAMQQAGGPVARPAGSGQQEDEASGAGGAAQGGSVKAENPGKSEGAAQSGTNGRRSVPGESLGSTRTVSVGTGIVAGAGVGSKPVLAAQDSAGSARWTAESASLTIRDSYPEVSAGTVAAKMPGAHSLPGTSSLSGTQGVQIASAAAAEDATAAKDARAVLGSAVAAAGPLHGAVAAAAANKPGQEDATGSTKATGDGKSTEKADASVAKNSKLTALMPQGTVVVAQDAGLVPPAMTLFATVPGTVPDGESAANSKPMPLGGNESGKPVSVSMSVVDGSSAGTASAVTALREAVGPTASSQQADHSAGGAGGATGSAALAGTRRTPSAAVPVSVDTPTEQGESAASWTRGIQGLPEQALQPVVAASLSEGMGAPVPNLAAVAALRAVEGQRAGTSGAVPDQAMEASLAVSLTDKPTPGAASKIGLQGGRGAVAMAATGGPAAATSAFSIEALVGASVAGSIAPKGTSSAAQSSAAATTPPAVPGAAAPAAHPAAEGNAKNAAMAAAQRVQGPGTLPVKAAAAAGGDASVPAAKVASEPGMPAAQPALAAAEPVAGLGVNVPVLVAHETVSGTIGTASAPGAAATSGAAGIGAGTQEVGGAGLSHTTLSATPTSLEVGVSGGTHGWLKIRAELNATGEVNASLTGATAAATDKLRSELPALNNYLQGERVTMGTLDVRPMLHAAVTAGESGSTFSPTSSGQGSAGQGGSGQGYAGGAALNANAGNGNAGSANAGSSDGQRQQQGGETIGAVSGVTGVDEVVPGRVSDAALSGDLIELGDSAGLSSVGYGAGGGRLNVRA